MREFDQRVTELTGRVASSTLDTYRFPNGNILMQEPVKDIQPPKNPDSHRVLPNTQPEGWEHDLRRQTTVIDRMLRGNPEFNRDPEAFLEKVARGVRPELGRTRRELVEGVGERWDVNPEIQTLNQIDADEGQQARGHGISTEGIRNEAVRRQIEIFNQKFGYGFDPEDFKKALENIHAITGEDPEGKLNQEKQLAARRLSALFQRARESKGETVDRFGFYLETQDLRDLDDDPMGWLDEQFNAINNYAKAGSELDSPVLQRIQTEVGEASAYLQKKYGKFEKKNIEGPEEVRRAQENARILEYFNRVFAVRLNLIYARTTIEQRGMEQISGAMGRLREGLIGSLAFDRGRVGMMYRRMQGELEHLRNYEGGKEHHLNPESLNKLQRVLIDEFYSLAKRGVGEYAADYSVFKGDPQKAANADRLLKAEITRSVRTAYDVLVASQRVAVISSRGGHLANKEQYFSDNGGAFAIFNLEEMSIEKWGLLNHEEQQFLEFLKLDLAMHQMDYDVRGLTKEQLVEFGGRLLKELYTVPDYYSSSWRMTGIREQMTRTTQYKAENDAMIKKVIDNPSYAHANPEINEIIRKLRILVGDKFEKWRDIHPDGLTFDGEETIIKRNIARDIFKMDINKDERDLLLQTLTGEDMVNVLDFVSQSVALEDGTNVSDFGLFIQLRQNLGHLQFSGMSEKEIKEFKKNHRKEVWGKIQKYKAEEILRILRSRAKTVYMEDVAKLEEMDNLFSSIDPELALNTSEKAKFRGQVGDKERAEGFMAFNSFDKFQEKYGSVLNIIREDALRNSIEGPQQVDFRNLSRRHQQIVERALGSGSVQRIKDMYVAMDKFIGGNNLVKEFMESHKYSDLYARVLSVDDVMLEDLQTVPDNSGILTMEEYWTGEVGGSPTKRNMNDLGNAIEAGNAFIAFMVNESKDERFKNAKAMKGKVEAYNGRDNGAQIMRFTYGTEMLYAMQDYIVNVLRLGGLPFRRPTSEKQRDYGIGAKSMTRDEIREELDHHKGQFVGLHDHGKWFTQLEELTNTDASGRIAMQSLTFLFYIFLALGLGVPLGAAYASINAATK